MSEQKLKLPMSIVLLLSGILVMVTVIATLLAVRAMREAEAEERRVTALDASYGVFAWADISTGGLIGGALETYKYDMGKYPDTDEGLNALLQSSSEVDDERYKGPYSGSDRFKDYWGNPFEYRSPGKFNKDGFDLWSCGPDGVDDLGAKGTDDIKNWVDK